MLRALCNPLFTLFLLLCAPVFPDLGAQTRPLQSRGTTRAVVVGISEYRDSAIWDLRFAHRDAQAFAGLLQSGALGSVAQENIRVITDEEATEAHFRASLEWLLRESQAGDQAILYFSGHGDVGKLFTKGEYLLLHDADPDAYITGGAMDVVTLQHILSTLSIEKNVGVLLFMDACRSGKMKEARLPGAQVWGEALLRQEKNEIRLLSCRPEEDSREGEQWGGGHGVFTHFLLHGLSGLADLNGDGVVTAGELRNYLEENVRAEVQPARQQPQMVCQDLDAALAIPTEMSREFLLEKKNMAAIPLFRETRRKSIRGNSDPGLADSTRAAWLEAFHQSLDEGRMLGPGEDCADHFFRLIMADASFRNLQGDIARNYGIALQDKAQRLMHGFYRSEFYRHAMGRQELDSLYGEIPPLLRRSLEVLGEQHRYGGDIHDRLRLCEAILQFRQCRYDRSARHRHPAVRDEFLHIAAESPYGPVADYYLITYYSDFKPDRDSLLHHTEAALARWPHWGLPLAEAAYQLIYRFQDSEGAGSCLDRALALEPERPAILMSLAAFQHFNERFEEAAATYRCILQTHPDHALVWSNLAATLAQSNAWDEALEAVDQAIAIRPEVSASYYTRGCIRRSLGQLEEAAADYAQSLALNGRRHVVRDSLAQVYLALERHDAALAQWTIILETEEDHTGALLGSAKIHVLRQDYPAAANLLRRWLQQPGANPAVLDRDPEWQAVLNDPHIKNQLFIHSVKHPEK
jgi:protein O-mannosyl-transferase